MEFKSKQAAFCDSGYNSLDWDESRDDKQEDSHAQKAVNEDDEEEEESFSDWLKKVAKYLHSRPNHRCKKGWTVGTMFPEII